MSIKISLKKNISEKNIKNYVLFANEDFKIDGLAESSLKRTLNSSISAIVIDKSIKKNLLIFNLKLHQRK